jgi:hypothetical protein
MAPGPLREGSVVLPGGLVAEGGLLSAAELRPLTGREEEWLAAHPGTPSARAVTWLLGACLLRLDGAETTPELVRRLLVGDRDYLMLQLRRLTLGDRVSAVIDCPACGAKMDVDFNAEDVPVERRPQTAAVYTLDLDGRAIRFRLPTGGDQEAALGLEPASAADALLARCLLEDGMPLTAGERAAVVETMDRLAPQIDLELDLKCPACTQVFVAPFDTTAFFLHEMRINGRQLLREVHFLAFYYHWSEADILSLRRDRRRAYLALLRDALRPDGG